LANYLEVGSVANIRAFLEIAPSNRKGAAARGPFGGA